MEQRLQTRAAAQGPLKGGSRQTDCRVYQEQALVIRKITGKQFKISVHYVRQK